MDLVAAAADELMALDATWTMLGNGEPRYEELWTLACGASPGPRVGDASVSTSDWRTTSRLARTSS